LEDGTKKELSELTQPEFDKLIKEQKEGPKTVEDIGRSQLKTTDVIMNDLKAIKQKVVGGVVTAPQATQYTEGARRTVSAFTGAAADSFDTSDVRRETQTAIGDLETLVKDLGSGNKNSVDAIADYLERAGTQLTNLDTKVKNSLEETSRKVQENLGDKTAVERYTKDLLGTLQVELDKGTDVKNQPISSLVTGQQTPIGNQNLSTSVSNTATAQSSKMDIGGTLNHNIVIKFENPPPNMTQAQLDMIAQSLSKTLNSPQYLASMQNNNKQFNPFGNNSPAYYNP
jgi:DNA primase